MQGIDRDYPNGLNQSSLLNNTCYDDRELGYGGICFRGHYCPMATSYPIVCDNGTYANVEGLSSCDQCPMGKIWVSSFIGDIKQILRKIKFYFTFENKVTVLSNCENFTCLFSFVKIK